tara:strand:- start:508 stop:1185 length:678 start_codon:yes stop_codon:yes gene_type:complete
VALTQSIEQAIEQLCFEGVDESRQLRLHLVEITNIEWNGEQAKIQIDHPDISQWGTGLYLNPEQSAKLTDPKNGVQVASVGLYLGKKKNNTTGENLYDYWWSAKVFEGIENPKTFWVDSDAQSTQSSEPKNTEPVILPEPVKSSAPSKNGANKTVGDRRQAEINISMCYRISCERLMKLDEYRLQTSEDTLEDIWNTETFKQRAVLMTKDLLKGIDDLRGDYAFE